MPPMTVVPGYPTRPGFPAPAEGSTGDTPGVEAAGLLRPHPGERGLSSPLRKRWARTPAVPRPLAGYSAYVVTLSAPGWVPGSAADVRSP